MNTKIKTRAKPYPGMKQIKQIATQNLYPRQRNQDGILSFYSYEAEAVSFKHDLMIFPSFEQASRHSSIACSRKIQFHTKFTHQKFYSGNQQLFMSKSSLFWQLQRRFAKEILKEYGNFSPACRQVTLNEKQRANATRKL